MHFAKTYAQLLVTLPPELRNNVFEYRKTFDFQLKQLINRAVSELDSLGLSPSVLRALHTRQINDPGDGEHGASSTLDSESASYTVFYEIALNSSVLEPRLRLSSTNPSDIGHIHSTERPIYHVDLVISDQSFTHIMRTLPSPIMSEDETNVSCQSMKPNHMPDVIIPLPSDAEFFQLLTSTLSSVSAHLGTLHHDFNSALIELAASISSTALPVSSTAPGSFSAYSLAARNAMSFRPGRPAGGSDLYAWRGIFRLYTEVEVFESFSESTRGERSVEEAEKRLKLFEKLVRKKKLLLVLPESREALDVFLRLNLFILEMKKLHHANSEAARKILKKHAKRTTFPIPSYLLERDNSPSAPFSRAVSIITRPSVSLPRLLVQAISEVLLPVIPHIDDYSCIVCTFIAFRPIRLHCGHFFCVRCLAKMQKRRMPYCPMCRAPTVLKANPSNVDYALLNFMADWFPIESREKLRANDREVSREQNEEFGLGDVRGCRIM